MTQFPPLPSDYQPYSDQPVRARRQIRWQNTRWLNMPWRPRDQSMPELIIRRAMRYRRMDNLAGHYHMADLLNRLTDSELLDAVERHELLYFCPRPGEKDEHRYWHDLPHPLAFSLLLERYLANPTPENRPFLTLYARQNFLTRDKESFLFDLGTSDPDLAPWTLIPLAYNPRTSSLGLNRLLSIVPPVDLKATEPSPLLASLVSNTSIAAFITRESSQRLAERILSEPIVVRQKLICQQILNKSIKPYTARAFFEAGGVPAALVFAEICEEYDEIQDLPTEVYAIAYRLLAHESLSGAREVIMAWYKKGNVTQAHSFEFHAWQEVLIEHMNRDRSSELWAELSDSIDDEDPRGFSEAFWRRLLLSNSREARIRALQEIQASRTTKPLVPDSWATKVADAPVPDAALLSLEAAVSAELRNGTDVAPGLAAASQASPLSPPPTKLSR